MNRTSPHAPLHPTAETFDKEVLQSDVPVLVDFWAPWCPPCRLLKPELEHLAAEFNGSARVAFVNVDEQPQIASMYSVSSIPALAVMKGGKVVDSWTGYLPRAAILARMKEVMLCGDHSKES